MRRAGLPLLWGCDPTTAIWASFVLWFAPSAHASGEYTEYFFHLHYFSRPICAVSSWKTC